MEQDLGIIQITSFAILMGTCSASKTIVQVVAKKQSTTQDIAQTLVLVLQDGLMKAWKCLFHAKILNAKKGCVKPGITQDIALHRVHSNPAGNQLKLPHQ